MFNVLTVSWGSVTVILVGLLIYRALIGMREEDQLFLATGEEHQPCTEQGDRRASEGPEVARAVEVHASPEVGRRERTASLSATLH